MQGTANGLTADEVARRTLTEQSGCDGQAKERRGGGCQPRRNASARFLSEARFERALHAAVGLHAPVPIDFGGGNPSPRILFPIILNNYDLQATLAHSALRLRAAALERMASANHNKTAAQLDEQATRLSVARDARVDYYQWIRAQGGAYVAAKALEAAHGPPQDAKNAFDAGLVSRADVLRTVSQQKTAELAVARARQQRGDRHRATARADGRSVPDQLRDR